MSFKSTGRDVELVLDPRTGKFDLAVAGGVLNYGELRVDGLTMANNSADNGGDLLSASGILNLGNGQVSGDIAGIRETMPVVALGR